MQLLPYKMWPVRTKPGSLWLMLLIISSFTACNDVFEEDLSDDTVILTAPSNGVTSTATQQLFSWEPVEDALDYRIQIATPDFTQIQVLELDSYTVYTDYTVSLIPGQYEWRVKAYNNSSETDWSTASLTVDSSTTLGLASVQLQAPGSYSNVAKPQFLWDDIAAAEEFVWEIYDNEFGNGNPMQIRRTGLNSLSLDENLEEGTYNWGVSAQAGLSRTLYTVQELVIDLTDPEQPDLEEPTDDDTWNDTTAVQFSWRDPQDNGSPLLTYFTIFNNASGTAEEFSDTTTAFSFSHALDPGTYYWQVQFEDRAGNVGAISELYKLTVQ